MAETPKRTDTPDASGTRQRTAKTSADADVVNPASLSASREKKVPRNKPHVEPPFYNMSMNRFLTYMVLGLGVVAAFYMYRFTVWAADAGGYWNLVTGARPNRAMEQAESAMEKAAEVAGQAAQSGKGAVKGAAGKRTDVQGQIYALATALGVKPADLSSAIRPLIDPTVPNPADACQKELELVKLQLATGAGAGGAEGTVGSNKVDEKAAEGSLLGLAAEALLD